MTWWCEPFYEDHIFCLLVLLSFVRRIHFTGGFSCCLVHVDWVVDALNDKWGRKIEFGSLTAESIVPGLELQTLSKICHTLSLWCIKKLLVKVLNMKAHLTLAAVSHAVLTGFRQQKKPEKSYSCPSQPRMAQVTCTALWFDIPVFSRYVWGLSLNTYCDMCRKETAVVWLLRKPGENMCCVCALAMTSYVPWCHRGNSERQREEGANSDTSGCDWSSLSLTDLKEGKQMKGKPGCSQYYLFVPITLRLHVPVTEVTFSVISKYRWLIYMFSNPNTL